MNDNDKIDLHNDDSDSDSDPYNIQVSKYKSDMDKYRLGCKIRRDPYKRIHIENPWLKSYKFFILYIFYYYFYIYL